MEKFTVEIPVADADYIRFRKWTEHYKMSVKKIAKCSNYYIVTGDDPLNLYWLGANMFGNPPETTLTKHRF